MPHSLPHPERRPLSVCAGGAIPEMRSSGTRGGRKGDHAHLRTFFSNIGYRISQSLQGRNGMDTLAKYLFGACIVLLVINIFLNNFLISLLALACIVYSIFRCYSSNVSSRALENARFESWVRKPQAAAARTRTHWANRKTTKYFRCPSCKQSLSVPRGKGTLRVTCPHCRAQTTI